jgi:hypothetical protein
MDIGYSMIGMEHWRLDSLSCIGFHRFPLKAFVGIELNFIELQHISFNLRAFVGIELATRGEAI